jgi:hypothetical protein
MGEPQPLHAIFIESEKWTFSRYVQILDHLHVTMLFIFINLFCSVSVSAPWSVREPTGYVRVLETAVPVHSNHHGCRAEPTPTE